MGYTGCPEPPRWVHRKIAPCGWCPEIVAILGSRDRIFSRISGAWALCSFAVSVQDLGGQALCVLCAFTQRFHRVCIHPPRRRGTKFWTNEWRILAVATKRRRVRSTRGGLTPRVRKRGGYARVHGPRPSASCAMLVGTVRRT